MHDPIATHFRRLVNDGQNVFLTGMAGTGKSTMLRALIEELGDEVTVTASTGIAALNIGGSTVHRWSGMMLGPKRGDQVSVLSGLKDGDEIVTSGVFKLRAGAPVRVDNSVQPGNELHPAPPNT